MKAIFSFFFLCLISITSLSAQITSEGCSTGYIRYYLDNDGDGYGTGSGRCHASQPAGTSILAGDCDDSNPAIHPNTVWYADTDEDGLGDPSSTLTQCLQPINYVLNSNDQCPTEAGPAPTGCAESSGGSSTFSDMNYVHTVNFKKPYTSAPASPTTDDVLQEITYLDGLGRPIQNIKINQALEGTAVEDLVTEITYDSYGRSTKDYLPYAEATATPGAYQPLDLTEGRDFYWGKFPADFTSQTATNAYSEKSLEASPLSRVLKQAAPGSSWKMGSGREIEFDYLTNGSSEVRQFKVNLSTGYSNPTISTPGYYAARDLYKNVTRDENHSSGSNHTTEEFINKKGQVVLKRTYNAGVAHDTYYVYDDYGNLTFVLPPLTNSTDALPTQTEITELCYQYKYDGKNRLIEKKIPGKGWEFIVYNPLDQPILTKDANLSGKWLYTKYDAFGRVVSTGLHTHSATTQSAMQTVVNNHYSGGAEAWENHTSTSANYYYTNRSYPTSSNEVLTLNYYDDYNFDATSQGIRLNAGASVFGATVDYGVKGLPTGSKVKILDQTSTQWVTTVTHYDDHGQVIYTGSYNDLLQVKETVKNELEPITGNVLKTETYHKKGSNAAITVTDEFTYDDLNRLEKHSQSINGGAKELIADNTYDDLGRLVSKGVGNVESSSTRLQNVTYNYNVRGWLKQINNPSSLGSNLFGFKLNYNTVNHSGTPLYNGNIAEAQWKTQSDNVLRWYRYGYDNLNRLTSATASSSNYNVSGISYDKNGNILNLTRNGWQNTSSYLNMDILDYDYSGNKLTKVRDDGNDSYGFKDSGIDDQDYWYDNNGNMTRDDNKGITGITYNHLNLPKSVSIGGGTITYIYDATGVKQRKIVSTTNTITDYAGNFMYKGGTLQFFNHSEGYVENNAGTYKYHYQYKDHLGNIRLSYFNNGTAASPSVVISEENNYYPFGLRHKGYNDAPNGHGNSAAKMFKFGGKELQDETIGGKNLDWYDFHARNYDAALGRWMNVDPLAEKFYEWSSYNYTYNNPLSFIDPTGMGPTDWYMNLNNGNYEWHDGSAKKEGYTNIGKHNDVAVGKGYSLKDNGIFTDNNTGKVYGKGDKLAVGSTGVSIESNGTFLEETKTYVNHNKNRLLSFADDLQTAGDGIAVTGYGAAVIGSAVVGVGAAPGATIAGIGNMVSVSGSVLEVAVKLLTADYGAAGPEAGFIIGGAVIDFAVDKTIPGPTPEMSEEISNGIMIMRTNLNTIKPIMTEKIYEQQNMR